MVWGESDSISLECTKPVATTSYHIENCQKNTQLKKTSNTKFLKETDEKEKLRNISEELETECTQPVPHWK